MCDIPRRSMHIYTHPACLQHNPPHPELMPMRLKAVTDALRAERFGALTWHEPPALKPEELYLAHTPEYASDVLRPIAQGSSKSFANYTFAAFGTADAALFAASVVMAATGDVIKGNSDKAFCIVSPPGHHAEADAAGGYCFFNNIALAAIAAQIKMGTERVAVIDFDAHHGNGTQSFFWNFEDRLYISLHEENSLSGFAHETGAWNNIVNISLPKESSGNILRHTFTEIIVPKLSAFRPDILFVSAGFDMHADDPLSSLRLIADDYYWLGKNLGALADKQCNGRLVAALEGGYNLDVLGKCAAEFVSGIMETENV